MAAADYVNRLQSLAGTLPGQDLAWLQQMRDAAMARFAAAGFPTQREEEWKYTNLAALERQPFLPTTALPPAESLNSTPAEWLLPDVYRLIFVDGRLDPSRSLLPDVVGGYIGSLAALLESDGARAAALLSQGLAGESHGLIQLNNAGFGDGAVLHLPAGCQLDKPLQLVFHNATPDAMAILRNLIVLEAGAAAEIVETYLGGTGHSYLTAAVNEITLAKNARLTLTKLQSEAPKAYHFGGNYARLAKSARFEHHHFAFGGLLARSEVHVSLAQGCDCQLNGLFLAQDRQHLDNHLRVDHREAQATSREYYNGIVGGRARGVFQGRVIVHPDAQGSDAAMSNRNLLLSQDAEIDTKPQLEIYADDVKCAHGVTIGQLDEEAIFFLKSRGLDDAGARGLLTFAFANERVDAVANPALRGQIRRQLLARFPGIAIEKDWL